MITGNTQVNNISKNETVQKFTTFEDLKASEKKAEPSSSSLQKHDDLKTLMAEIRHSKAEPKPNDEPKQ